MSIQPSGGGNAKPRLDVGIISHGAAAVMTDMCVHVNAGSCCHVSMSPFMELCSIRHLNQIDFLKQWQQSVILSAAKGQNALKREDTMPKD